MTGFDLAGPLPKPGSRVLLEASAGTGKTHAIVTLAARHVAEGHVTLDQLLLITFTRDATSELRTRLRAKLTQVATAIDTGAAAGDDPVLTAIDATGDRRAAAEHIRAALGEFDRATIATTHEFCSTMLTELGMLADHDVAELLADDRDAFIHEVAMDCWLRRFSKSPALAVPLQDKFAKPGALPLARRVTGNPGARLWPSPDDPTLNDRVREQVAFAHDVRREFEARKRRHRVQTFDDLQDRLHEALAHPKTGPLVAQRLANRFPLVMVDEFQDTDPVQWQVLRLAFSDRSTMVLIGDPKQAIYGFRGADVHSYLDARSQADQIFNLARNWRTDAPVQKALDALFHGACLGDDIPVTPVESQHPARLFTADDQPAPGLRLLLTERHHGNVTAARQDVARHVGSHLAEVLLDPPMIEIDGHRRPVRPGDMAILVRTRRMGESVRDELHRRRVPVVFPGASGVFAAAAAGYWETLLHAVDEPRSAQIRKLAVTPLVGWTLHDLAMADEQREAELVRRVRQWGHTLTTHGVGALFDAVAVDCRLPERLLATEGGERLMTDLRHLSQVLHRAQRSRSLNSTGLLTWLRERRANVDNDEEPRRLETDSDVVTITTLHRAKGLEFPLVYLPDTWERTPNADVYPTYHAAADPGGAPVRMLDVSGPDTRASREHEALGEQEQFDEDLRLFYVAATRAEHQLTLWWAPVRDRTRHSALQRMLFGSVASGVTPPTDVPEPQEPRPEGLAHLTRAGADVRFSVVTEAALALPELNEKVQLAARSFHRPVDLRWRRTSYSGLTAEAHAIAPNVTSEPPVSGTEDEPVEAQESTVVPTDLSGLTSPMSGLPAGTRFGTLVHAIYEQIDFRAPDLAAELLTHTQHLVARMPLPGVEPATLAAALQPSLETPLGPLASGRRLADVATTDRLPELDFDYPLSGGNTPRGHLTLGDIAALTRSWLPADDPLVDYPDALADPVLARESLRGFLTGSIDAVLRFTDARVPRYVVVDYKTNWLGPVGVDLVVDNYHPRAMAEAMTRSHYPLQALLYQVALHRYLRWRQPDYQPEQHLGGVLYLFVRGMAGPDTPVTDGVPHGVFSWAPPTGLIIALSDLIASGGTS